MTKKNKFVPLPWKDPRRPSRKPSISAEEVGEIFWEVAHRIDVEVPWVKLDPELDAEIRLGSQDLLVLELHAQVGPHYVAFGRVVEGAECDLHDLDARYTIVVELLRCTEVTAHRLEPLAEHARLRTKQPRLAVVLNEGVARVGCSLEIKVTPLVSEARVVLL